MKTRKVSKKVQRAVTQACRATGAPETATYAAAAAVKLQGLIKDGVTVGEALAVARYASKRYGSGDRFPPLLNLAYTWSGRKFPELAAAMRKDQQQERRVKVAAGRRAA